jgi:KaiC/GvpD/RAD55 family RecA-like ATPase
MVNLIKTEIPGFDELLNGGLKEKNSILIAGSPGTGKTIFALQYLFEGAKKGESGIYITLEESPDDLREYAKSFGWDVEGYEKKGLITFVQESVSQKKFIGSTTPITLIKQKNIKRAVIDSITLFEHAHILGERDLREDILDFISEMKGSGVTLIATAEKSIVSLDSFNYSPEDFLFDGLVVLVKIRKGNSYDDCITVQKMRGQEHSLSIVPVKITKKGIRIFPNEIPFSLIEKDVKSKRF